MLQFIGKSTSIFVTNQNKRTMIREIVKINEEKCDGCGVCVPSCHEGALQIIDGKARLISDLMCDGLGACLNDCPKNAIGIERREAEPYDEVKVMEQMIEKGKNTVLAHLKHLKEHGEDEFLREAVAFLHQNEEKLSFSVAEIRQQMHASSEQNQQTASQGSCGSQHGGCPGSKPVSILREPTNSEKAVNLKSELQQWPVQMHLINPAAPAFRNSDLLLAADCVAFSVANFHQNFLKGKSLAIACPKLDDSQEIYENKIISLINEAQINTITVMIMQVPCCGGLLQMAESAAKNANRKIPLKLLVVSIEGEVLREEWRL